MKRGRKTELLLYMLSAVLAVSGFIGWILPRFLYLDLCAKRTKVVTELIERKYDEIYAICEQLCQ